MQTLNYHNPTVDKAAWGQGPWVSEPDKKQWRDAATGLPCLIVRNIHGSGSLCGYVGLSEGHPFFGLGYNDMDCPHEGYLAVHGGVTFSGACQEAQNEGEGICHRVEAGEDDNVWWVGFDCGHADDFMPMLASALSHLGGYWGSKRQGEYRDMDYVTGQVEGLARQLKAVGGAL